MVIKAFIKYSIIATLCLLSATTTRGANTYEPDDKPIRIMGDWCYAPYEYINQHGKPTGFNIELIEELMRELEIPYELSLGSWHVVMDKFRAGEVDILTGLLQTPDRDVPAFYSMPIAYVYNDIVVREGSDIETFDDLTGREIIVQEDDKMDAYLKKHPITPNVIRVDNADEGIQLLTRVDTMPPYIPTTLPSNL